jgi:hypothetical protein
LKSAAYYLVGIVLIAALWRLGLYFLGPYLLGLFIGAMVQTAAVAYVILRLLRLERFMQTKINALVITAAVTALLSFILRSVSDIAEKDLQSDVAAEWDPAITVFWIGWAIGLGFMAWWMTPWPSQKCDKEEARKVE